LGSFAAVAAVAVGSATVALDQAAKAVVAERLSEGRFYTLAGPVGLRRVRNVRGGLGGLGRGRALVTWLALAGCATATWVLVPGRIDTAAAIGIGLSLGGAAGNLIDRMRRGAVEDFIVLGPWPVFNLADIAMTAGVGLVGWSVLA
jgi:signal peptidase II